MTVDTSTEAVERHMAFLEETGNKSGAVLLRALAAERDAARNALQFILDGHIGNALDDVKHPGGYTQAQQEVVFENIKEVAEKGLDGSFKTPDPFKRTNP